MSSKLIVIKLGGSVITYKDSPKPKANLSVIKNIAIELEVLFKAGYKIILVHGAGSYGHPLAKKYQLHKGMQTEQQKKAFAQIHLQMLKLNSLIMKELITKHIPAVTIPPHALAYKLNNELVYLNDQIIKRYLKINTVPVLFGDAVLDDRLGCSILSGDTIVSYLAKKLEAGQVIFLSDVNGVFDKNPKKNRDAVLISEINNQNINKVLKNLLISNSFDISGEMKGKILMIKKDLLKIPVLIANGLDKDILIKIIQQQKQVGTKILLN